MHSHHLLSPSWGSASRWLFALVLLFPVAVFSQPNRVQHQGRNLFINGGNVAWISFGGDVGPGNTDLAQFESMFREVRDNGGNSMRLWLHPTGNNLAWNGLDVTGPGEGFIADLTGILNLAMANDVSLMLTLWSFDMLRISNGTTSTDRNFAVLTDTTKLKKYIDNALIPMVTALKDHPAILAWEICNEPEGMSNEFGWDGNRKVPMSAIQRMVNRMAGAIHRVDSKLRVTNGAWSFKSTQDAVKANITTDMNYYRNDRLIAAGGDPDGKLDFYTVHYYDWAGTNLSPFHHHADRWNLDKPLVVAEFYMKGNVFSVSVDSLYKKLYQNGYAGAMAWQWVDFAQNRDNNTASWPNALKNMRFMRDNYLADVSLSYSGLRIESFRAAKTQLEAGESTELSWTVRGAVSVTLNGAPITTTGTRTITPTETTTYLLKATAPDGYQDSVSFTVQLVGANGINRARGATIRSNSGNAAAAIDGNLETEWIGTGENSFLTIQLNESILLSRVQFEFGETFATDYRLERSIDGINWFPLSIETSGNGDLDIFNFTDSQELYFFRVTFTGFSSAENRMVAVKELSLFGSISPIQPPQVNLFTLGNTFVYEAGNPISVNAMVIKKTDPILRVVFYVGTDSIGSDSTDPYTSSWTPQTGGNFEMSAVVVTKSHRIQSTPRAFMVLNAVQKRRFEAESATRTGTLSAVNESSASGGRYVKMDNDGTMTWSNISFARGGKYTVRFGYRLPFDVKTQYIRVNGVKVDSLVFNGAVNVWLTKDAEYSFSEGLNTISIEKYWGYMHFDFVEIRGDGQVIVANEPENNVAKSFSLGSNYPNPFNPTTTIPFSIEKAAHVKLELLDINGRLLQTLADGRFSAGSHLISVDAGKLSSGLYMYRMTSEKRIETRKMMLLK